ncbi:MAG: DUF4835 domain-containing protein [Bacteroidetes bacterium GWA2_31_9]|nr:MAG: DUF4835 domain-containing protein [Bacteroidetes bacterium GWA2_31_9]
MRFLVLTIIFLFITEEYFSQELNCRVQVMSQQIQGTNKKKFETMQNDIYEFMNNHKWTENVYTQDEKIECNIMINITEEVSSDEFKATLQVQCSRPVFNSTYNTVMLNYLDNNIQYKYVEFQPLEFSESSYTSELTSLLAYYAYIFLGLDYDSFSLEGGSTFFNKAEIIVNNAQNSQYKGWKAFESTKNRYWLVENILNDNYSSLREFTYNYHRLGLDRMADKSVEARTAIAEDLKLIQKAYRNKTNSTMIFQLLYDVKADEFVNIFSESFVDEKARVFNILKEVDPANISKYNKIMSAKN